MAYRSVLIAALHRACVVAMGAQVIIGVIGAALHLDANVRHSAMTTLRDRFVYGAPAFGPLLFANLALLTFIGLWASRPSRLEPK